jgi:16S rRNA (guanine966-N2)-methyltransferase
MRIIAGIAKGMTLAVPRGEATRPTSDRVREAIFSSLGARVTGARVLDLFAGTGALGLEAASRGAAAVVFVERGRAALAALERNLAGFKQQRGADVDLTVWRGEVLRELPGLSGPFDLIFADPPYEIEPSPLLAAIATANVLAEEGRFVLETSRRTELDAGEFWECERAATYGDTRVSYLRCRR